MERRLEPQARGVLAIALSGASAAHTRKVPLVMAIGLLLAFSNISQANQGVGRASAEIVEVTQISKIQNQQLSTFKNQMQSVSVAQGKQITQQAVSISAPQITNKKVKAILIY